MINKRRKAIYVTNFRQSASKKDKQKIMKTDKKTWKITREKSIRIRDLIEQETHE